MDGSDSDAAGKEKSIRKNPMSRVLDSASKKARVFGTAEEDHSGNGKEIERNGLLSSSDGDRTSCSSSDSDWDSGHVNKKEKRSKGKCISRVSITSGKRVAVLDSTGSVEKEVMEKDILEVEEKVLGHTQLDLDGDQVMKDGENGGITEKKMILDLNKGSKDSSLSCNRRRSVRLMEKHKKESGRSLMLDLNSVPEDGLETHILEEAELGFDGDQVEKGVEEEGIEEKQIMRKGKLGTSSGVNNCQGSDGGPEKRKGAAHVNCILSLNFFSGDQDDRESLNVLSGTKITRKTIEVIDIDSDGSGEDTGKPQMKPNGGIGADLAALELEMNHPVMDRGANADVEKRYNKEEKGKGQLVEGDWLSIGSGAKRSRADENPINEVSGTAHYNRRYTKEEKGKGKLVGNSWLSIGRNGEKLGAGATDLKLKEEEPTTGVVALDAVHLRETQSTKKESKSQALQRRDDIRSYRERFRDVAKEFASKYAHFEPNEEEDDRSLPVPETEILSAEAGPEDEDWPGPFSTAMKIIEERTARLNARRVSTISNRSKAAPMIEWTPSKDNNRKRVRMVVPSLQDLCFNILCQNADAITSLEGVPEALKSKITRSLCDSRKMSCHILGLIVCGAPSEICLKDCSWMTEEQFKEILGGCNTECLRVLQLDQCGRCMPDYILRDTLACSPNSLSSLVSISLKGAYRLSDSGLNALVSSAPSLKSINLGQCSLITSTGINTLAEKMGSVLKELYIDDCQNIDAMLILHALKKLKHLEVLSVAGVRNVCDKFVSELIPICGPNMKELVFADCGKMTDASLKVIAENCSGLHVLDLGKLKNLTDLALRHLANGCRSLQVLKLCRNGFSDEGVAAFLEASGESLTELVLNNVKEVSHNTAMALSARCSKTLLTLDLSWCRKLMDEALGLIVDKCSSLRLLKLFGCTQVSYKFLHGHSNPFVKIIGLKSKPILEQLDEPDMLQASLRF